MSAERIEHIAVMGSCPLSLSIPSALLPALERSRLIIEHSFSFGFCSQFEIAPAFAIKHSFVFLSVL